MAGLIMDCHGLCYVVLQILKVWKNKILVMKKMLIIYHFLENVKIFLHILIQKKSGWKLYYRVIVYIDGCI